MKVRKETKYIQQKSEVHVFIKEFYNGTALTQAL